MNLLSERTLFALPPDDTGVALGAGLAVLSTPYFTLLLPSDVNRNGRLVVMDAGVLVTPAAGGFGNVSIESASVTLQYALSRHVDLPATIGQATALLGNTALRLQGEFTLDVEEQLGAGVSNMAHQAVVLRFNAALNNSGAATTVDFTEQYIRFAWYQFS